MSETEVQDGVGQLNEDIIGSRYALEVAFQTMRERCQKLQQRLGRVEEENAKLRIQRQKEDINMNTGSTEENLREKVAELEKQKQQLAHHISMVSSENKQLWSRLSQSAKINHSLGSQLNRISDTLNRHPTGTNLTQSQIRNNMMLSSRDMFNSQLSSVLLSKTKDFSSSIAESTGPKADSLEEISLKLINSFLQEKSELEDQCLQMAELRDGSLSPSFSVDHLGISLGNEAGVEVEALDAVSLTEVQRLRDSLLLIKEDLLAQKGNLQSAVTNLARIKDGGVICRACQERAKKIETQEAGEAARTASTATTYRFESANIAEPESLGDSADEEIKEQLQRIPEMQSSGNNVHASQCNRVCPICGRFYSICAPFEDFHTHVVSHFEDEGGESLQEDFVVIPTEGQV